VSQFPYSDLQGRLNSGSILDLLANDVKHRLTFGLALHLYKEAGIL
jgi:hypothetical protein